MVAHEILVSALGPLVLGFGDWGQGLTIYTQKGLSYSWINKVVNANNFTVHYSSDTDSSGESEVFINNANHGFVTQLFQNNSAVCLGRLSNAVNL